MEQQAQPALSNGESPQVIDLIYVSPDSLDSISHLLDAGLAELKSICDPLWSEEEVWATLTEGRCDLYLGFDGNAYRGFIVLYVDERPHRRSLVVWLLHSQKRDKLVFGSQAVDWLVGMARKYECGDILMASTRKGMGRMAQIMGFAPINTTYRKEVRDG